MPHWQTTVALAAVFLTLLVFLIRMARPRPKGGCGHDCGCDHPGKPGADPRK